MKVVAMFAVHKTASKWLAVDFVFSERYEVQTEIPRELRMFLESRAKVHQSDRKDDKAVSLLAWHKQ